MRLPKNMRQPNENPPQVSVILCMNPSFAITTSHMKLENAEMPQIYGRLPRPTSRLLLCNKEDSEAKSDLVDLLRPERNAQRPIKPCYKEREKCNPRHLIPSPILFLHPILIDSARIPTYLPTDPHFQPSYHTHPSIHPLTHSLTHSHVKQNSSPSPACAPTRRPRQRNGTRSPSRAARPC